MLKIYTYPNKSEWSSISQRPALDLDGLKETVNSILNAVKQNGDKAVLDYTKQFDGVELNKLLLGTDEIKKLSDSCDTNLKAAIDIAYKNIYKFHSAQKEEIKKVETTTEVNCWRKSVGIENVGLYIPGGSAPLFSTVLMLGIPASIAGCNQITLCTPPNKNGLIHPAIAYAASKCGITTIALCGGVQAIAAMAFGTSSINKVDKIFGPGNQYVTCAKQMINQLGVAIDMPAGPSEVAVIADETATAEFIAADLLSQAEHGGDSQVILLTISESIVNAVNAAIEKQLKELPRKAIAEKALQNSKAIVLNNIDECVDFSNQYAPEHLILNVANYNLYIDKITNAGSVFLGNYTPESAGDYASGTNHTLPTNGYARAYSGVSLDSFVKKITFQEISKKGLQQLGNTIETMAEAEGLTAHKNAVTIRIK